MSARAFIIMLLKIEQRVATRSALLSAVIAMFFADAATAFAVAIFDIDFRC